MLPSIANGFSAERILSNAFSSVCWRGFNTHCGSDSFIVELSSYLRSSRGNRSVVLSAFGFPARRGGSYPVCSLSNTSPATGQLLLFSHIKIRCDICRETVSDDCYIDCYPGHTVHNPVILARLSACITIFFGSVTGFREMQLCSAVLNQHISYDPCLTTSPYNEYTIRFTLINIAAIQMPAIQQLRIQA